MPRLTLQQRRERDYRRDTRDAWLYCGRCGEMTRIGGRVRPCLCRRTAAAAKGAK